MRVARQGLPEYSRTWTAGDGKPISRLLFSLEATDPPTIALAAVALAAAYLPARRASRLDPRVAFRME